MCSIIIAEQIDESRVHCRNFVKCNAFMHIRPRAPNAIQSDFCCFNFFFLFVCATCHSFPVVWFCQTTEAYANMNDVGLGKGLAATHVCRMCVYMNEGGLGHSCTHDCIGKFSGVCVLCVCGNCGNISYTSAIVFVYFCFFSLSLFTKHRAPLEQKNGTECQSLQFVESSVARQRPRQRRATRMRLGTRSTCILHICGWNIWLIDFR